METPVVKVSDVANPTVHDIDGLASVQDAIDQMKALNVNSLIIRRRHDGDEYGLVTAHDIAAKVVGANRSTRRTSVYEVMNKPALTLDPDMNVKYALRLLANFGISRALVMNGRTLVGVVTLRDLIFGFVESGADDA